jgi:hypothetical protein
MRRGLSRLEPTGEQSMGMGSLCIGISLRERNWERRYRGNMNICSQPSAPHTIHGTKKSNGNITDADE